MQSLLPGISNFDFSPVEKCSFSDEELEIPERLMLGKRAECYFSEWVRRSANYELVAQNVQIIDKKQTLGEFDFLLRRKTDNQLIHVELVYKYYLFDPEVKGLEVEKWIGPNRGDQLDFKLDKLNNHQFPLLKTAPAIHRIKELGVDVKKVEQQVLFLANLFVPLNQTILFQEVNQGGVEGSWMRMNDWEEQFNADDHFFIPEKKNWFLRELSNVRWLSRAEAYESIQEHHNRKRSPLVYSKGADEAQRRDFVVWW